MNERINTKPELNINFNDLPPGSYIIKDGKLLPNLDDEAMKARSVIANEVKQSVEKKEIENLTELQNGPIQ